MPMPESTAADKPDVPAIYQLLRRGEGHQFVDKGNVDELLQMAEQHGHAVLAEELREFKSDKC